MKFLRTLGFLMLILQDGKAYSIVQDNNNNKCQPLESSSIHRRQFMTAFGTSATISTLLTYSPQVVRAFDGSGSSAYSGRSPATKAELKRQYRERVVADVRDFNALGDAIRNGETEGKAWVNFFIQFQRREPDSVGRTYAALVDLRGIRIKKEEFEGGDGMLLANTFTKSGKPPDNTPAVKSFKKLSPSFDAIEAAGKNGDAKQALAAWEKTKALLEAFLADVELPSSINDPIYK
eukprot:scaffold9175_cov67-Cylindrotheca_fusiformis.AAC.1